VDDPQIGEKETDVSPIRHRWNLALGFRGDLRRDPSGFVIEFNAGRLGRMGYAAPFTRWNIYWGGPVEPSNAKKSLITDVLSRILSLELEKGRRRAEAEYGCQCMPTARIAAQR
jgi:hypothetical protein